MDLCLAGQRWVVTPSLNTGASDLHDAETYWGGVLLLFLAHSPSGRVHWCEEDVAAVWWVDFHRQCRQCILLFLFHILHDIHVQPFLFLWFAFFCSCCVYFFTGDTLQASTTCQWLSVNQANLQGMAVSNYDRNLHMRKKALAGVAGLKKHPAETTFYVLDEGREHLEWKKSWFNVFLLKCLPFNVKSLAGVLKTTNYEHFVESAMPSDPEQFFSLKDINIGLQSWFRSIFGTLPPLWWGGQLNETVVNFSAIALFFSTVPLWVHNVCTPDAVSLFHFPSIRMEVYHCSIVPSVSLFHVLHCPLFVHPYSW